MLRRQERLKLWIEEAEALVLDLVRTDTARVYSNGLAQIFLAKRNAVRVRKRLCGPTKMIDIRLLSLSRADPVV